MSALPSTTTAPPPPLDPSGATSSTALTGDRDVEQLTRGVWLRSITGLLLIALLATATFFILQDVLSINRSAGTVVNISGRQRMLSQRGALFATRLATSTDAAERQILRTELDRVATLMLTSHEGLTRGDAAMGLPGQMSDTLRALYFDDPQQLDRQVRDYVARIRTLIAQQDAGETPTTALQAITTAASGRLLETLNRAVVQYEKESEAEVQRAIRYEQIVYGVTLLALLLEALLIYRPLVNRVRRATESLVRQQQFSDRIVDTAQALIIGLDPRGRVTLFNQHSQRLSGHTEAAVRGQDFLATFMPGQDPAALQTLFLGRGGAQPRTETTLQTRDGRTLTIEWSNTVLTDPIDGHTLMHLATGVDITARQQARQALQSALDESAALSRRLQQEVAHAAVLQRAMLPPPEIRLPGLQGRARLTTSSEVGGDYYDAYAVDGRHAVFVIGDVSGHGVAAGTLVSAAKMAVHQLASRGETDPAAMLEHLNDAMLASSHDSMFMTMLCCSLDARTGRLRVANAGHAFPYCWMAAEQGWGMVEVEGLPLGRVREPRYVPVAFDLAPGDRLFLYTDGLVEQENAAGDPFTYERVEHLLYEIAAEPVEAALDRLFGELSQHAGRPAFDDDVTAMLVEHTGLVATGTGASAAHGGPARLLDPREIVQLDAQAVLDAGGLPDHLTRQRVVVTHEPGAIDTLLGPLCEAGVRRVLPTEQPFLRTLGWQTLLSQHQRPDQDDLAHWIPAPTQARQWSLAHSDDKARTMADLDALLTGSAATLPDGLHEILVLMADELIENGLYGAPLDAWQRKRYAKGQSRDVELAEGLQLALRHDGERLGLAMSDRWGTFTPAVFLKRLALNAGQQGIVAGVGGAGLYLMWRMSDYLQIRVRPQRHTQITLLWSLHEAPDPERDAGFQFLYHHELGERLSDTTTP